MTRLTTEPGTAERMKNVAATAAGTIGPRFEAFGSGRLRPGRQALVDPTIFVNGYFDAMASFRARVADQNARFGKEVAGAAIAMQRAFLEQSKVMATEMRDQVVTLSSIVREQVTQAEAATKEQAEALDRELRREAAAQRREERAAAAAPFQEMTKVELQGELEKRDLVKTGTVDELRARLTDAELADAK